MADWLICLLILIGVCDTVSVGKGIGSFSRQNGEAGCFTQTLRQLLLQLWTTALSFPASACDFSLALWVAHTGWGQAWDTDLSHFPCLGGGGAQPAATSPKADEGAEAVLPKPRSVFHIEWSSIRRRSKGVRFLPLTLGSLIYSSLKWGEWQYLLHRVPGRATLMDQARSYYS